MSDQSEITCVINTKDRYFSTLPLTLIAVCQQTLLPSRLIIFDDGEHRDLRGDPLYAHIFGLMNHKLGGKWEVVFAGRRGQVANHIKSLYMSTTGFIWRLDDDNLPEPNVLEKLVQHIQPKVGAVGGLVVQADSISEMPPDASNKIEDIYLGKNEQWFLHTKGQQAYEVDHLYSSFIYRREIADYCEDLSVVGHREETILTFNMHRKGYANILEPNAITWHLCNPQGGLRAHDPRENYSHDERIFSQYMSDWKVAPVEHSTVVLDDGLGDHFAFKKCLDAYFKKNEGKKHTFYVCFPEVFEDVPGIQLASIADAKISFGNIDRFNLYAWMNDRGWKKSLSEAFCELYRLSPIVPADVVVNGTGNTIIISPYSFNPESSKSYPFWRMLISMFRTQFPQYHLVQIGREGEEPLKDMNDYWWGIPLKELQSKISECRLWISVDNFLQHMVNTMSPTVRGVVIWGVSDPELFGYKYNLNILKSRQHLRPDQFGTWPHFKKDNLVFEDPTQVFEKINQEFSL